MHLVDGVPEGESDLRLPGPPRVDLAIWSNGDYSKIAWVTGIDYVAELVETARRRTAAEGLSIAFEVADAEALPFADSSFDYVVSAIGVMFTADHDRAAGELVRVCKPGGKIGLASWTAEGFIGQLLKTVGAHVRRRRCPPAANPLGQ